MITENTIRHWDDKHVDAYFEEVRQKYLLEKSQPKVQIIKTDVPNNPRRNLNFAGNPNPRLLRCF